MLLTFLKRNRIIKKAVTKTVAEFSERKPNIYQHLFYGAFELYPQSLAIWYLFATDAELELAKASGFCDELAIATINNLIDLGYPKEALETVNVDTPRITFPGVTKKEQQYILHSQAYKLGLVSFATKEDIDNKANGDYHIYFQ